MFDYLCIIVAVLLAATSVSKYRAIAVIIAIEFIAHKLAFNYILVEAQAENGWLTYMIYSVIQLTAMSMLLYLKSHFVITALIFINLSYNMLTALSYFYSFDVNFYQAYQYFVGTIMVFELIYLGLLNKHVYSRKHRDNSDPYIDGVFRVRPGNSSRGLS